MKDIDILDINPTQISTTSINGSSPNELSIDYLSQNGNQYRAVLILCMYKNDPDKLQQFKEDFLDKKLKAEENAQAKEEANKKYMELKNKLQEEREKKQQQTEGDLISRLKINKSGGNYKNKKKTKKRTNKKRTNQKKNKTYRK